MKTTEQIEELKHLSTSDRLAIIEAATRFIRADLQSHASHNGGEDPILRVAGCISVDPIPSRDIDKELYGEDQA